MRINKLPGVLSTFDAYRIDPRILKFTPGFNVRDLTTPQAIEALAVLKEQIRAEGGVTQPYRIRSVGDEIHIVDGHRRQHCVLELIAEGMEIDSVPAMMEPRGTNDTERTLGLIAYNSGQPLTQLETAEVVRRLRNAGWSKEKIATRLGYKTKQSIDRLELLLEAPEEIREAVRKDEISSSTAIELMRAHPTTADWHLPEIKKAAAKRGGRRATIKDIKEPTSSGSPSAAEIERRNEKKLVEHSVENRKSPSDISRLETVLSTLLDFYARGIKGETLADVFGTRKVDDIAPAADWLYEFCDALRQKENSAYRSNVPDKTIVH
jgi:ParB family transcriptional regulator, chromosome partitioning protein